jgi:hypothetical protein
VFLTERCNHLGGKGLVDVRAYGDADKLAVNARKAAHDGYMSVTNKPVHLVSS